MENSFFLIFCCSFCQFAIPRKLYCHKKWNSFRKRKLCDFLKLLNSFVVKKTTRSNSPFAPTFIKGRMARDFRFQVFFVDQFSQLYSLRFLTISSGNNTCHDYKVKTLFLHFLYKHLPTRCEKSILMINYKNKLELGRNGDGRLSTTLCLSRQPRCD
jgi:hypothetical protein